MSLPRTAAIVGLAVLLAVPAVLAAAPETPSNVRITIEIGRLDGSKKVPVGTYQVTTVAGNEPSALNVNTKLALPVDRPPDAAGMVSFNYQNVGLGAKLRALPTDGGRVLIRGELMATFLRDAVPSHPSPGGPSVGSLNHDVNVVVKPGKPVRLLTVDEAGVGPFYVELAAESGD